MKHIYTLEAITEEMELLKNSFDVVRLVQSTDCVECTLTRAANGRIDISEQPCRSLFPNGTNSEPRISARTMAEKKCVLTFERSEGQIFAVYSKYVEIEGNKLTLELAKNVTESFDGSEGGLNDMMRELDRQSIQLVTDDLTRVHNRRYINEHYMNVGSLDGLVRKGVDFCLAIIDIDHFKDINDEYGHQTGDETLVSIANFWKKVFMAYTNTFVARYGGDEFLVISMDMRYEKFVDSIKSYYAACQKRHLTSDGREIKYTMSIGCAALKETKNSLFSELFSTADKRMYHAKQSGRNCIVCEDED